MKKFLARSAALAMGLSMLFGSITAFASENTAEWVNPVQQADVQETPSNYYDFDLATLLKDLDVQSTDVDRQSAINAFVEENKKYAETEMRMFGPAAPVSAVQVIWLGVVNGRFEVDIWVRGSGSHNVTSTSGPTRLLTNRLLVSGGAQPQEHLFTFDLGFATRGTFHLNAAFTSHNSPWNTVTVSGPFTW